MNQEGLIPRKKISKEFEAADPFNYQHLDPDELEFEGVVNGNGRKSDTYSADGYTFHKIKEHQMPERQHFRSLLLKGTCNVADIVRGPDGGLYSKDMHSGASELATTSPAEQYADMLVLSTIFNDNDHSSGRFPNNISLKEGSHSLFDFDGRHRGRAPDTEEYVGAYQFDSRPLEAFTHVPNQELAQTIVEYKRKIQSLRNL
ncbi:MAG: hypothetical protein AB199_01025 [Parcubacteria bacterium C7867-004]|nr:MAG: hypothetical protein AB199_01025 [Parcubacteria bacterium C7867-004]